MFEHSNVIELKECLACGAGGLNLILDLHKQPLANSYKKTPTEVQQTFPLAINHCGECHHVQLTHAVNPDLMFKDYLYVSGTSNTMKEYFAWFANWSYEYYFAVAKSEFCHPVRVFDIGCNDGSQLDAFVSKFGEAALTSGVDPAVNLFDVSSTKGHTIYNGYFDETLFQTLDPYQEYEILIAQNVFAHNYNPIGFLETAKRLMHSDSLLFIQTSQADMILNNEFDTIYHEHISFYNINSMKKLCDRAGLHLIDVIKTPLHGNSYVFIISRNNIRPYHIENLIAIEQKMGLLTNSTYVEYGEKCDQMVSALKVVIKDYREGGYIIIGYGAAAKGMTLLHYSDISMYCIIDDNPLKQGLYTPGENIPICSIDILQQFDDKTRLLFVPLAWNFFDEIRTKIKSARNSKDDRFLLYFPNPKIVS